MGRPTRGAGMPRRTFLAGLGAAGAATTLFPWTARAEDDPIKRLILFYTPHGTIYDQWRPSGPEVGFTFSPILAPLSRHRDKLVVVDGLRMRNPYDHRVPHTYDLPALWTGSPIDTTASIYERKDHGVTFGWNTGVSIDQYLASRLAPMSAFRTLELGIACGGAHPATRMIYTGPAAPRNPMDNPQLAYDLVFAGLSEGQVEARRKRAVLDAVLTDMNRVSTRLSASDRVRLDAHATSLREIEASLEDGGGGGGGDCEPGDRPLAGGLDVAIDQQSRLLATAMGCGLTTIGSIQLRIGDNDGSLYPWAGIDSAGHHAISHERTQAAADTLAGLYTWYAERFAQLLDHLDALPDGNGQSVLDNSVVVWGSEISRGWDHTSTDLPFVVAGGGAGRIRGGRWLQTSGALHNRLLVSIAHAMGVDDVQSYGDTDTGTGGIPGLLA